MAKPAAAGIGQPPKGDTFGNYCCGKYNLSNHIGYLTSRGKFEPHLWGSIHSPWNLKATRAISNTGHVLLWSVFGATISDSSGTLLVGEVPLQGKELLALTVVLFQFYGVFENLRAYCSFLLESKHSYFQEALVVQPPIYTLWSRPGQVSDFLLYLLRLWSTDLPWQTVGCTYSECHRNSPLSSLSLIPPVPVFHLCPLALNFLFLPQWRRHCIDSSQTKIWLK